MSKTKSAFFCQNCGHETPKWLGKCPSCQEWNTFVEEILEKISSSKNLSVALPSVKKGSKVVVKVRTPSGAILPVVTTTVSKTGSITLPTLDFKKIGSYQMVISINGKISTLKITVKK
jgi:DNA repair protein RadA/Sms